MIERLMNFIVGYRVYAQTADEFLRTNDPTVAKNGDFFTLVQSLIDRIPYILGGMALLGLLYSGFLYITAFGDATKMESAKKNITWIFTGIIAVAAIILIMNLAIKLTGSGQLGSGSNAPF